MYGAEINAQPSKTPALCDAYCVNFYHACGNLTLNWAGFPNGATPFNSNPFITQYPTDRLFCKIFAAGSSSTVCYSGAKVVPPTPVPADADATGTCIERLGDNSMDPTKMIVSVVGAHDDSNYIYVQFKRGEIQIWDRDTAAYVTTFMTLPFPILNSDGEAGFTSLVFHPNYKQNGRFFVVRSSSKCAHACAMHACMYVSVTVCSIVSLTLPAALLEPRLLHRRLPCRRQRQ